MLAQDRFAIDINTAKAYDFSVPDKVTIRDGKGSIRTIQTHTYNDDFNLVPTNNPEDVIKLLEFYGSRIHLVGLMQQQNLLYASSVEEVYLKTQPDKSVTITDNGLMWVAAVHNVYENPQILAKGCADNGSAYACVQQAVRFIGGIPYSDSDSNFEANASEVKQAFLYGLVSDPNTKHTWGSLKKEIVDRFLSKFPNARNNLSKAFTYYRYYEHLMAYYGDCRGQIQDRYINFSLPQYPKNNPYCSIQ